ncbi:MAG TPA: YciI-like protein [Cyclobacteriaceae bacterium]
MYFLLSYYVVDDYIEKRQPYRAEHLSMAKEAHDRGELLLGGALTDPADQAILLFKGEDDSAALEFAKNDPYVKNGVVKFWEIRKWTVVIGGEE